MCYYYYLCVKNFRGKNTRLVPKLFLNVFLYVLYVCSNTKMIVAQHACKAIIIIATLP